MLFAAGILGFVFVGELEDSVRSSLEKSLKENYGVPGKESITDSWDSVQQTVSTVKLSELFEPPHDKTNKMTVRPAKTQISLGIRPVWSVFAVRMKKAWVLSYPLSTQRRLWSDWADAQADLSLCWMHSHFIGFVMRRLIYTLSISKGDYCLPFFKYQMKMCKSTWTSDLLLLTHTVADSEILDLPLPYLKEYNLLLWRCINPLN